MMKIINDTKYVIYIIIKYHLQRHSPYYLKNVDNLRVPINRCCAKRNLFYLHKFVYKYYIFF